MKSNSEIVLEASWKKVASCSPKIKFEVKSGKKENLSSWKKVENWEAIKTEKDLGFSSSLRQTTEFSILLEEFDKEIDYIVVYAIVPHNIIGNLTANIVSDKGCKTFINACLSEIFPAEKYEFIHLYRDDCNEWKCRYTGIKIFK